MRRIAALLGADDQEAKRATSSPTGRAGWSAYAGPRASSGAARPYRAAMAKDTAVAVLRYEVRTGRLDGGWVEALAAFVDDPGRDHGAPTAG